MISFNFLFGNCVKVRFRGVVTSPTRSKSITNPCASGHEEFSFEFIYSEDLLDHAALDDGAQLRVNECVVSANGAEPFFFGKLNLLCDDGVCSFAPVRNASDSFERDLNIRVTFELFVVFVCVALLVKICGKPARLHGADNIIFRRRLRLVVWFVSHIVLIVSAIRGRVFISILLSYV